MRKLTTSGLVLVCLALAACGGGNGGDGEGGDKTFESKAPFEEKSYSFTYPGDWEEQTAEAAGGDPQAGGVVLGAGGANYLAVGVSQLNLPVTAQNIAEASDSLVADTEQIFREAQGGITTTPKLTTVAGLPAIRLEATAVNLDGTETKSHLILMYDGTTEYFINCQYTPDGADEMTSGCDQVADSFQVE